MYKRKNLFLMFLLIFLSFLLIHIEHAKAACIGGTGCSAITTDPTCTNTAGCTWVPSAGGSTDTGGTVSLPDPLGMESEQNPVQTLIGKVISAVLGIVGSLALVMFIYGGLVWMTAAGNTEKVTKGKDILTWAAVGLVVIFSAYAMVTFVFSKVLGLAA